MNLALRNALMEVWSIWASRVLFAVSFAGLTGCDRASSDTLVLRGHAMGTTWQVTLDPAPSGTDAGVLRQRIAARLERIEDEMSHWRKDSVVSQFNRARTTKPFEISADLANVIQQAQRAWHESGGAFDVTAGPLVRLWGFGPDGPVERTPSNVEIEHVLRNVGSDQLVLEWDGAAVARLKKRKKEKEKGKSPAVEIDLSAIAKGYAIDRVASLLDGMQVADYLIELGGELAGRGRAWHVGIEHPAPDAVNRVRRVVTLEDECIATSGNYRLFFPDPEDPQKVYSHILDPRTGRPVQHKLCSVSVIASRAMRADVLATTLMVLGPDQGMEYAHRHKLAATFVIQHPGGWTERSTPQFTYHATDGGVREPGQRGDGPSGLELE